MRILFYRYNSICEPDLLEAFSSCGLSVVQVTAEITDKSLTNTERINLLREHLDDRDSAGLSEPFLFVFSVNFFPAISDLCEIYQIPYVCWSVDSPLAEIYSKSVLNSCNRLFLFDRQQYNELHELNPDCIFYLPLCTNPQRWDKQIASITDEDKKRFSCDISFIGSLYTEKDPYLSMIGNTSTKDSDHKNPSPENKETGLASNSLSDRVIGFADGLVSAQLSLTGCNILEDALTDETAHQIASAQSRISLSSDGFVKNMDRYIAGEHVLGMHASSLYRINALKALSEHFDVSLYTRSPLPDSFQKHITDHPADLYTEKTAADKTATGSHQFSDDRPGKFPGCGIHIHPGVQTLTEMPRIFNLSKINLNMTIYPIRSGLSLRIWDVLGCGGFLLTNAQPELTEYFIPGEDLDCFSSVEELIDKCSWYLDHDDVRQKIAKQGSNKVHRYHTYNNRFSSMLKTILDR